MSLEGTLASAAAGLVMGVGANLFALVIPWQYPPERVLFAAAAQEYSAYTFASRIAGKKYNRKRAHQERSPHPEPPTAPPFSFPLSLPRPHSSPTRQLDPCLYQTSTNKENAVVVFLRSFGACPEGFVMFGWLFRLQPSPPFGSSSFVSSSSSTSSQMGLVLVGLISGLLGSILDSLMGAVLQASYFDRFGMLKVPLFGLSCAEL